MFRDDEQLRKGNFALQIDTEFNNTGSQFAVDLLVNALPLTHFRNFIMQHIRVDFTRTLITAANSIFYIVIVSDMCTYIHSQFIR